MDIEIIVVGETGKWVLNLPRIRIGLDPNCEVNLPPGRYPSVAGVHLVLETVNGAVSLARELPPGGETFLNGHPANAGAAIRSGTIGGDWTSGVAAAGCRSSCARKLPANWPMICAAVA